MPTTKKWEYQMASAIMSIEPQPGSEERRDEEPKKRQSPGQGEVWWTTVRPSTTCPLAGFAASPTPEPAF
jgi:hypothetical protein